MKNSSLKRATFYILNKKILHICACLRYICLTLLPECAIIKSMEVFKTEISKKLKELRTHKKVTMQTLCEQVQLPQRTYQNYEYGVRTPTADVICKLADYYGVSADEILGRTEPDYTDAVICKYNLSEKESIFLKKYLSMPEDKRAALTEGVRYLQYTADFPLSEETTLGEIEDKIARQDGETYGSNVG